MARLTSPPPNSPLFLFPLLHGHSGVSASGGLDVGRMAAITSLLGRWQESPAHLQLCLVSGPTSTSGQSSKLVADTMSLPPRPSPAQPTLTPGRSELSGLACVVLVLRPQPMKKKLTLRICTGFNRAPEGTWHGGVEKYVGCCIGKSVWLSMGDCPEQLSPCETIKFGLILI